MNKKLIVAGLLLGALPTAGAWAAGCGKPRNAFDQVYCKSTEYSQADRDLNTQYTTLRKTLNEGQQATLRKAQLAWIKERDEACSLEKPNGYYVNLTCAMDMTQERVSVLKERERECKSTGCNDAKLAQ
ncbi:lysozyme inhibitor LprI family protein [Bordetella genomosp. 13]|uniref:lysozyme inhibitor LprI family protein n=1 Tax=Bordetella genomosp. 13 TaxID=463040 RepID=UPI00119FF05B|nr:lysozyme inhibitor LprI family protein [Bordetella genomosp. 13]